MTGLTKYRLLQNTEATLVAQYLIGSPVDELYTQELDYLAGYMSKAEINTGLDYLEENDVIKSRENPLGESYFITDEGKDFLEVYGFTNAEELLEREHMERDRSDYFGPRH